METIRAVTIGRQTRWQRLLALLLLFAVVATACGSEPTEVDESATEATEEAEPEEEDAESFGCVNRPIEPIAWWTFDEQEAPYADGIGGLSAVPVGTNVSSVTGQVGGAVDYGDDYLRSTPGVALGTGDFAIEAWINPQRSNMVIASNRTSSSSGQAFMFELNGGSLLLQILDGSTFMNATSNVPIPLDQWSLVSVSVDRDGEVAFTVNSSPAGSEPIRPSVANTDISPGPMNIGFDAGDPGDSLTGSQLDELKFYDRCFNTNDCIAPADGLVAWYPFDSVPSQSSEVSEYSPSLPYVYTTHAMEADLVGADIGSGKVSGALDVRGQQTYATAPLKTDALDFGTTSDWSVDMWVYFDDSPGELRVSGESIPAVNRDLSAAQRVDTYMAYTLPAEGEEASNLSAEDNAFLLNPQARAEAATLALEQGGEAQPTVPLPAGVVGIDGFVLIEHGFTGENGWALWVRPDGELVFSEKKKDSNGDVTATKKIGVPTDLLEPGWHLVAFSVDRTPSVDPTGSANQVSEGSVWIDGVERAQLLIPSNSNFTNTAPLNIGAVVHDGAAYDEWPGFIDEVEIFKSEITDQFVKDLYQAGTSGKCKPEIISERICSAEVKLSWTSLSTTNDAKYEDFGLKLWPTGAVPPTSTTKTGVGSGLSFDPSFQYGVPTNGEVDHSETFSVTGVAGSTWEARVLAQKIETLGTHAWTLTNDWVLSEFSNTTGLWTSTDDTQGPWNGTYVDQADPDSEHWPPLSDDPFVLGCEEIDDQVEVTCSAVPQTNPISVGTTVTATAVGAPVGSTFEWDFGEATYTTVGSPTQPHTYGTSDGYKITVTVDGKTYPCGSYEVIPANVDCSIVPDGVVVPGTSVTATAVGIPAGAAITWYFGDGTYQTAGTLSQAHTYNTPGSYTVGIEWRFGDQGGEEPCGEITVEGIPPRVECEHSTSIEVGDTLTLNIIETPSAGLSYRVDWGDGSAKEVVSPGPSTHVYAVAGTYAVRVEQKVNGDWVQFRCGRSVAVTESVPDFTVVCSSADWPPMGRDLDGDGVEEKVLEAGEAGVFIATVSPSNIVPAPTFTWEFAEGTGNGQTFSNIVGPSDTIAPVLPPGVWTVTVTADVSGSTKSNTCSGSFFVNG